MPKKCLDAIPLGDDVEEDKHKEKNGDFGDLISGVLSSVPLKMAVLLYIVFIIINSTVFIEYCIEPLGKSYHDGNGVTEVGTYLQGLFLVVGYMIMYALVANEVI